MVNLSLHLFSGKRKHVRRGTLIIKRKRTHTYRWLSKRKARNERERERERDSTNLHVKGGSAVLILL
jgi:hypothetical protein